MFLKHSPEVEPMQAVFLCLSAKVDERQPSPGTREQANMLKTADRVLGVHGFVTRVCFSGVCQVYSIKPFPVPFPYGRILWYGLGNHTADRVSRVNPFTGKRERSTNCILTRAGFLFASLEFSLASFIFRLAFLSPDLIDLPDVAWVRSKPTIWQQVVKLVARDWLTCGGLVEKLDRSDGKAVV